MKKNLAGLILIFLSFSLFGQERISPALEKLFVPKNLVALSKCYPTVEFEPHFDIETLDWKITLTANVFENRDSRVKRENDTDGKRENDASDKLVNDTSDKLENDISSKKQTTLFWADGKMLPKSELKNKDDFWPLQYKYQNVLRDPKSYTDAEIENIKKFGSSSNRRTQSGTPMFFFDFIYSASSQRTIEEHIISTTFLGKRTRIHERILPQIKKVEAEILEAAKTDDETKNFVDGLKSADAYYWRQIAGTSRKSFHSYGISIDVLPRRLYGKAIYWSWEKDKQGDRWMLTPLEKRWTPGKKVIGIFEENGFIWGGNWVIFDNMHFEYHPELTTAATDGGKKQKRKFCLPLGE